MAASSPYIVVNDPKGERKVPVVGSVLTIGRNITNMVVIDEVLSSRFHCVIERTKDGYRVRDLDSRNGIQVNGKQVKFSPLHNGDVVTIGDTTITFKSSAPAPARSAK